MSADLIFSICNMAIIPGWLLLVFLPRWKWTLGLITAGIIPFMLALVARYSQRRLDLCRKVGVSAPCPN